jgi:cation transport regulator ChaC
VKAGTNVEMTQAFIDAQGRQRWVDRAVGLGVGLVTGGVAAGVAYRVGVNHGAASLETDVPATSSNRPVVAARG